MDTLSAAASITSGVSQGSVLGLLLFLVHFRGIPEAMSPSQASLFADDTMAFQENCCGEQTSPCCDLGKHLGNLSCWAASNNVDFNAAKSADLVVGSKPPPSACLFMNCDTKSATSCPPGHHCYIWFALEWPCCHCTEESCACTTPVSYPRLSSSATSSSYSEILRCVYTTAHGVLQCCVVWRVSQVSEVTGKGAAESRKSHCSLATWATGTWGAFWV